MSLDLYLRCSHCNQDATEWNYTYNVSKMWYSVYPEAKGMIDIEGMTGKESLPRLIYFAQRMRDCPGAFKEMNPPNGWGSYDSFLKAIEDLIKQAKEYPTLIWRASR